MIADSSLTSEPEVRGPMAADGNSERLNGRALVVLYLQQASFLSNIPFCSSIPRRIKHLCKPKLTHQIG